MSLLAFRILDNSRISVLTDIGWVWSTDVEIHVVSSKAWERFVQHDTFCNLPGIEGFG